MYKFKHQLCFNKSCYLFGGKIGKQFALFSDKFTQLFKNFTRPPVAAVAPNINSGTMFKPILNIIVNHNTGCFFTVKKPPCMNGIQAWTKEENK